MSGNEVGAIGQRLLDLRAQHREVHELIEKLLEGPSVDQVTLRRLKKRKLQLKDMISRMESDLIPDLDA
ncbi:MAG: YdcH family protein [Gammaproteobacteria bacterium]|nr:YdcH family protein [Gammaproteobacteria bacterium]